MKLSDVRFKKHAGVVADAPQTFEISFFFSNEDTTQTTVIYLDSKSSPEDVAIGLIDLVRRIIRMDK